MIVKFDSLSHFVSEASLCEGNYWCLPPSTNDPWFSGNFDRAIKLARSGDDSLVSEAEKLLDSLEVTTEGDDIRQYQASPNGAFVIVPEYLAGFPMPMRVMQETGEKSPIRIVVCITCSAIMTKEDMQKRGIAILALVMKMQRIRPVELILANTSYGRTDGDNFILIPMDTKPVSLAHACFVLSDISFVRQLCYKHAAKHDGFNGQWPNSYEKSGYQANINQAYDIGPNDLYIKEAHSSDQLLSDPIAWINAQVAKFNEGSES